jgi:hypothetical protein
MERDAQGLPKEVLISEKYFADKVVSNGVLFCCKFLSPILKIE